MQFASEYAFVKEEALKRKPVSILVNKNDQDAKPDNESQPEKQPKQVTIVVDEEEDDFEEHELRGGIRSHSINSARSSTYTSRSSTTSKFRRIDTNVFRVDLSTLSQEAFAATGDPVICSECHAIFSSISKIEGEPLPREEGEAEKEAKGKEKESETEKEEKREKQKEASQCWECEFCGHRNEVHIESEEMPQSDTMDFVLSVPDSKGESEDENNVIFCVDTSGSMCVTTEVQGRVQLKLGAEKMAALQASLNPEGGQQYMPGWSRNVTYISRLQCVQAAVGAQLDLLAKESPRTKVGLVSFANDVLVTGDGKQEAKVIAGDKLSDFDALMGLASELVLERPIAEAREALSDKISALEDSGATALGPALLISVAMAARKPGSKVILCTDGLANVGLGSMESEGEMEVAQAFYTRVAEFAKDHGVIINVISIKGTTCSMEILGLLADTTSGEVDIVDPLLLTTNFHSILAIPVLAVHVKATVLLHKGLFLRDEDDNIHEDRLEKEIGSVTKESSLTLEYGCKKELELDESVTSLPFQVQIHYAKLDGTKMVRVVSQARAITTKREEAEQKMDRKVLGLNSIKKSARYARSGDYESARLHGYSTTRLMSRNLTDTQSRSEYSSYVSAYEALDSELLEAKRSEESRRVDSSQSEATRTRRKVERAKYSDSTSKTLYQMSSAGYSVFGSGDNAPSLPLPPIKPTSPSTDAPVEITPENITTTTTTTSTDTIPAPVETTPDDTTTTTTTTVTTPAPVEITPDNTTAAVDDIPSSAEKEEVAAPVPTQEN